MLGGSPGWWDRVEGKPAIVMKQKYYVSQRGDLNTLPGKTHELKEVAWDSKKAGPARSCWKRLTNIQWSYSLLPLFLITDGDQSWQFYLQFSKPSLSFCEMTVAVSQTLSIKLA